MENNIQQFFEGLDNLFAVNRVSEAGEYLDSWLAESDARNDWQLKLSVLNERMGYGRSVEDERRGLESVFAVEELIEQYGLDKNPSIPTIWINMGTTLCHFGRVKEGMQYYEKAETVILRTDKDPYLLASLYNNKSAGLEAEKNYEGAEQAYNKALELLNNLGKDALYYKIVTYVNLANNMHLQEKQEKAEEYIAKMREILDGREIIRDASYASACLKCATYYENYGYQKEAEEITERARNIYAGNGAV